VPKADAEAYAKREGLLYGEVSAQESVNVEEAFDTLLRSMLMTWFLWISVAMVEVQSTKAIEKVQGSVTLLQEGGGQTSGCCS
jgi:hypothetical protein